MCDKTKDVSYIKKIKDTYCKMKREEEILQAALNYANNQSDIPIMNEFTRNLCIALGQAFMAGARWADGSKEGDKLT